GWGGPRDVQSAAKLPARPALQELGVLRRGQALLHNALNLSGVAAQEGVRVQPESAEQRRTVDAVRARIERHEATRAADEPDDAMLAEDEDHVFLNACPLVIAALGVQIDGVAALRDFSDQLGSANEIPLGIDSGLTAI